MFTGIIEELGKVKFLSDTQITITAKKVLKDAKTGDSIAVNGVCLTVVSLSDDCFSADVSSETMKVASLGNLREGSLVNLERAMPLNGRFGGHIVSGHIDGKGRLKSMVKEGGFYILKVELNDSESKYVVKKGSVAIDGISLTIADINGCDVKIAVIPHTYENTNLKTLKTGDFVNIETDILSKYVEKFLSTSDNKTGISMEFLLENGF